MSAQVLPFRSARTADEAWERYKEFVDERHEKNLWGDLEHNKRIARAWDEWSGLFLAKERTP